MALTYGQMTDLILAETYRDATFAQSVFNAVVSAVKKLETNQLFVNTEYARLTLLPNTDRVALPEDFISVLELQLVSNIPAPNNAPYGTVVLTASGGFAEMTFWELKTYQPYAEAQVGLPYGWALWGDYLYVTPFVQTLFYLNMFYYKRDGYYPTTYSNTADYDTTSIWLGDFTQDVTRYTARGIFYGDSVQSAELAQQEFAKADAYLSELKVRNSQRETINVLSM